MRLKLDVFDKLLIGTLSAVLPLSVTSKWASSMAGAWRTLTTASTSSSNATKSAPAGQFAPHATYLGSTQTTYAITGAPHGARQST